MCWSVEWNFLFALEETSTTIDRPILSQIRTSGRGTVTNTNRHAEYVAVVHGGMDTSTHKRLMCIHQTGTHDLSLTWYVHMYASEKLESIIIS